MKHIEVSRKIILSKPVTPAALKENLIAHLEKMMDIEAVGEQAELFSVTGTTGAPASITRSARLDIGVDAQIEGNVARICLSGQARPSMSLTIMYWALFAALLVVGLLPGSIETNAETSGPEDALIFVIFGIFIIMDINKKMAEPQELLANILESLNTRFG